VKSLTKLHDMRHGWRGLKTVWQEEWHFKYQVAISLCILAIAFIIEASSLQLLALFVTICIALASEIINTAIEDIGNKINPAFDERIGAIKDMSQAFVILSSLPAVAVFVWIVSSRL